LKGATEFDDAQQDVPGMLAAGLQLRDLTLYPLIPAAQAVVDEIRKAQAKGRHDHELYHLFSALSLVSDNGGGGGASLSNVTPQPVGTVGSAGVGPQAARDDHVHPLPFSTVQSVLGAATGPLGFNGQQLTSVANPTSAQAAATKDYVDTAVAGVGAALFNTMLQWASDDIGLTPTVRFLSPGYGDTLAPVNAPVYRVTNAGVLRYLRVKHNVPGLGGGVTYTVMVNGAVTLIACTFNAGATDGSDLSNFVSVNAGDEIAIRVTKGGVLTTAPRNVAAVLSLGA